MTINLNFNYPKFIAPAFHDESKFVNIVAGRRTGKTFNAVQWLVEQLLDPTTDWDFNPMGLWTDTTQTNIDKYVTQYFKPILADTWSLCHYRSDKKILVLPNKIPIIFGSAERPELLEGFEYPRGVLNEAGLILKKSSLWDNTLMPMFKGENTKVRVIGTPKGKNKFHHLSAQYKTYHYTCYDSPYWDTEELEFIKAHTPELVWKQEYLAEFIDGEGTVFRNIHNCIRGLQIDKGVEGIAYVMAIDLAKHEDFTVITIGDPATGQVVYKEKFNQLDWTFQKKKIADTWNNFNRPRTIIDSTGVGDPIYDDLRNGGMNIIPFKFSSESKKELIMNLSIALENETIHFPMYQDLIDELELFEYNINRNGNVTYNAPEGFHDDNVISLALLNYLFKKNVNVNISFI